MRMIRRVDGGLKVLLRTRFNARFKKIKLLNSGPEIWIVYLGDRVKYEILGYMNPGSHLDEGNHAEPAPGVRRISSSRKKLRRLILIAAAVILFIVMRQVMNPFGDKEYAEIPHGNHVHYVPKPPLSARHTGKQPTQRTEHPLVCHDAHEKLLFFFFGTQ